MEKYLAANYLRFSITDACDLKCIHCLPEKSKAGFEEKSLLSNDEIFRLLNIFVNAGITRVRITGGEPLIKDGVLNTVKIIRSIGAIEELSLTTNGIKLKELAPGLKNAGIDRVNISLGTLREEKYYSLTGFDGFNNVWQGIEAALSHGLSPVKLNVVILKGINDEEIEDFVSLVFKYDLTVRFIEFFPVNHKLNRLSQMRLTGEDLKVIIKKRFGVLKEAFDVKGNGPAHYFKPGGAIGRIGFINSYSDNFCLSCNRIRLDCRGRVWPCLFSGGRDDLGAMLRAGFDEQAINRKLKDIFMNKANENKSNNSNYQLNMSSIGG